jgi:DNA-binding PadR family transcriptional regulator
VAIKKRLAVTDGVLGMHLEKLEVVEYVTAKKGFVGRRPKTTYAITSSGRRAFTHYLAAMRRLLDAVGSGKSD